MWVGQSSKSKLSITKFNHPKASKGWEKQLGTYFTYLVSSKYDGGMDVKFGFTKTLGICVYHLYSIGGEGKGFVVIL